MKTPTPEKVADLLGLGGVTSVEPLAGDGSARVYYRVRTGGRSYVLLIGPNRAENDAWLRIRAHLERGGVRVPALVGISTEEGWILMEDMGGECLLDLLLTAGDDEARRTLYRPVLETLAKMQLGCTEGFTLATGFGERSYDKQIMILDEGVYFIEEVARGRLGIEVELPQLINELEAMAEVAAGAATGYFLHRDFQSRNLLRTVEGEWAVIDFQGALPGPLAYDAAALILDPYPANSKQLRAALFGDYLNLLGERGDEVRQSWGVVGSFRLMQALGAFAKLGGRMGKAGFLEHVPTALESLEGQLALAGVPEVPTLKKLVSSCRRLWKS